jgi:predicted dehydrogenase
VATPTSTHYRIAKEALEARKHVLVEKPITTRAAEAVELCELASDVGRVLMVGHVFVYNGAVRRVRQCIADGTLGRVYYVSMVRTNLGPIRLDVNAAWDLASHDISIVNYWLGADPIAAAAVGGSWINSGIEDAVFATLRYPGDILANLHVSWLNPRKAREITVAGDKRMLTFDDMNLQEPVRIYDKQVTDARTRPGFVDSFASFRASIRDGDITIPKVVGGEPLRCECDHFLDCIVGGKQPTTGGREGLAVVRALEAIDRSLRNAGREEIV